MKKINIKKFEQKIARKGFTDERLFKTFKATRNKELLKYNEVCVAEIKKRKTIKLHQLLREGGYLE